MKQSGQYLFLLFRLGVLLIGLGLILLPTMAVQAHANLVRSDPETGAVLAQAPQLVTLEFSEPLDPSFSKAKLADSNLVIIAEGPGHIDSNNNKVLQLDLPALSPGAYSIIWQARSAVDGHITNGIVSFSTGAGTSPASLLPPPGVPDPTTTRPPLADTLLRWLSYAAAALATGSILFGVFVWRPAYRAWETPDSLSDQVAGYRLRQLALLGITSLMAVSLVFLLFQAWQASWGAFQISYSQALIKLIEPFSGWIFWLRMALLGLLAYMASRLSHPGDKPNTTWWIAASQALTVLLTFSLQSHTAALDSPVAVAVDWLHITAMAAWLGGLLPLFLLLRQTELPAHLLVPRFSRVALISVITLGASGLYSAFLHVRTWQALESTIYGQALSVKSILFALLICVGAINLLVLSPRLRGMGDSAIVWLRYTIRTELAIGLLVLAAVGLMSGVSPALEALQARQRMGYIDGFKERGTHMDLWVAPDRVGENEIAVDLHGLPASDQGSLPSVLLRIRPVDYDLGITQVETKPLNQTRYMVRGSFLSIAGKWQIEVIVRQAGSDDIRHVFSLQVQPNPFAATLNNPVPATDASLLSGKSFYEQNCLPCHGPQGKGDGPAGLALRPPPADLTIHTAPGVHPDGQLFEWITNGYPGSAMPAFSKLLTEEQRWNLVNYIRTLARK
jgi:copper transport protein